MICLDNTDVIEGGASVAAVVDYQMHGLVGTTFTQLAAGVMGTTLTTVLYTAGAAVSVVSIILVNKHTSAVNVTLCLDSANGGNPRYIIPKTVSLGIGHSLHTDGARLTIIDASGGLVTGVNVSDTAYAAGWNGETKVAPSKNAVYDKIQTILGDVTAAANITDNAVVVGDDGAKGVKGDIAVALLRYVGEVFTWSTNTAPTGSLECNGAAVSRSTYSALFAIISDDFGNGDGSTTFNLPDLRGKFPRGWNHGAGNDPDVATRTDRGDGTTGDNVGTKQADGFMNHWHTLNEYILRKPLAGGTELQTGTGYPYVQSVADGNVGNLAVTAPVTDGVLGAPRVGSDTRPININLMYCIKY